METMNQSFSITEAERVLDSMDLAEDIKDRLRMYILSAIFEAKCITRYIENRGDWASVYYAELVHGALDYGMERRGATMEVAK